MDELSLGLLNVAKFENEQGKGCTADLYVDHVKTAIVICYANKKPYQYQIENQASYDLLVQFVEGLLNDQADDQLVEEKTDEIIEELLVTALLDKEISSLCKKHTVFSRKKGGELLMIRRRYKPFVGFCLRMIYGKAAVIYNEIYSS